MLIIRGGKRLTMTVVQGIWVNCLNLSWWSYSAGPRLGWQAAKRLLILTYRNLSAIPNPFLVLAKSSTWRFRDSSGLKRLFILWFVYGHRKRSRYWLVLERHCWDWRLKSQIQDSSDTYISCIIGWCSLSGRSVTDSSWSHLLLIILFVFT